MPNANRLCCGLLAWSVLVGTLPLGFAGDEADFAPARQLREPNERYAPRTVADDDRPPPIGTATGSDWNQGLRRERTADQFPTHPDQLPLPARDAKAGGHLPLNGPAEPRARFGGAELPPMVTAAGSLGIVLGLFLLVVWVVRRGMPKQIGLLPREAVELLGRAPFIGRQDVYLVRCGNKILLISATPAGVETLTEITEPAEVDRLAGLCQGHQPQSETASFNHLLSQFEPEKRKPKKYFGRELERPDFGHLELDLQHAQDLQA